MPERPDVVVVMGGADGADQPPVPIAAAGLVVAADSGLHRADALGLAVDHLIGDLDSVDPARLAVVDAGTVVHRHRADKDATDAELALRFAHDRFTAPRTDAGAEPGSRPSMVVVAGATGRLDLLLADVLLLAGPLTEPFDVTAHLGPATLRVVRPHRSVEVPGLPQEQVTLLPVHGPARGVTTHGFRWALDGATLAAATTRGVSNELAAERATVTITDGVVVVVQQGIVAPVADGRDDPYDPTPLG